MSTSATTSAVLAWGPPMRTKQDVDYKWKAIAGKTVDVVDTNQSGYTREEKVAPQDVLRHRAGMNALQIDLPMMWSTGVKTKKITEEQFRGGDRGKSRQADGPLPSRDASPWIPTPTSFCGTRETRTVRD